MTFTMSAFVWATGKPFGPASSLPFRTQGPSKEFQQPRESIIATNATSYCINWFKKCEKQGELRSHYFKPTLPQDQSPYLQTWPSARPSTARYWSCYPEAYSALSEPPILSEQMGCFCIGWWKVCNPVIQLLEQIKNNLLGLSYENEYRSLAWYTCIHQIILYGPV